MTVLRNDLLSRAAVVIAGDEQGRLGEALTRAGAEVTQFEAGLEEEAAIEWARARAPLRGIVFDARTAFAGGGEEPMRLALEQGWVAIRALATGALIPARGPSKIVLIAPPPDAGLHAEAARAGLDNLARTLSVEWARFGITTTAVMPGDESSEAHLAELVCFLVSVAGDYLSGCRLDLGNGRRGVPE